MANQSKRKFSSSSLESEISLNSEVLYQREWLQFRNLEEEEVLCRPPWRLAHSSTDFQFGDVYDAQGYHHKICTRFTEEQLFDCAHCFRSGFIGLRRLWVDCMCA